MYWKNLSGFYFFLAGSRNYQKLLFSMRSYVFLFLQGLECSVRPVCVAWQERGRPAVALGGTWVPKAGIYIVEYFLRRTTYGLETSVWIFTYGRKCFAGPRKGGRGWLPPGPPAGAHSSPARQR